jgi:predicted dehydrogenase/sugar phosphate isomerase/epimerase
MKDMGLVCSTLIFRDLGLPTALELIAEEGFHRVDLAIIPGFCPHFDLESHNGSDVERLKRILASHNLSVASVNAFPGFLDAPEAQRVGASIRRAVVLAAQLQAQVLTLPSGSCAAPDSWADAARVAGVRLREAVALAEEHGIEISVESPHLGTLTETVEQAVRFFETIDERVKCTFDTSHVFRGERVSLSEGLGRLGIERVGQIHLRDALGEDVSLTPGKGHADFRALFNYLRGNHYSGQLCLELEYDDLTLARRRAELRFARRYVECMMRGFGLPLSLRVRSSGVVTFFERAVHDPKAELRRHERIITPIRKLRPHLLPFIPVRAYDGYWRDKWYITTRDKPVVQPANSVPLSVQPPRPIRVCILGCGYAGTMHGFGFHRLSDVEVIGVCDVDTEKGSALARKLGSIPYRDLGEMLEAEKPDLLSVCTWEWQHHEPVIQALEAGADVFCEKMLASRYNDAQDMVKVARRCGRVLGVNFNYRFMPGIRKLWEIVKRRPLGKLRLLNIHVHGNSYHHALDLVTFLGGQIRQVCAQHSMDDAIRSFGPSMEWDSFDPDIPYGPSKSLVAVFDLATGGTAVVSSSCLLPAWGFILSVDAVFDDGCVGLVGVNTQDVVGRLSADRRIRSIDLNHKRGVFARGYEYCFYKSVESFMNAYVLDEAPETPGGHGLFVMQLESAVYQSNMTGRRVALSDATPI